ncbi:hypothetical protein HD806DRAFT_380060 [Xylariaceae sp. AK1471]|nr:hypothetical protein HD806DRAFT_380060 [Xylariaceae sp. AK1471]
MQPRRSGVSSVSKRTTSLSLTAGTRFLQRLRSTSEMREDEASLPKLGLFELTRDITNCISVIIFVHGLGGHPVKTWSFQRDPANFWPQKWLPLEPGLEHTRIFSFGYGGGYFTTRESTTTILDFSKKLLFEILTGNLTELPIIFVAHSMGGLVVKKAYMLALQDPKYQDVSKCMMQGAMIFLGTPHRGSESAATLHRVLSATIGSKAFIQELMRNSDTLVAINEDFRHHVENLTLWSFHETEPTSLGPGKSSIIVDRSSAVLGYGKEASSHIDANHHTICKFETTDTPGYVTIKKLLVYLTSNISEGKEIGHNISYSQSIRSLHSQSQPAGRPTPHVVRRISQSTRQLSHILGQEDTAQEDLLFCQDLRGDNESCRWILEKETYLWWMNISSTPNTQYLWLYGPPGMGKSVLLSFVIDQLHLDGQICAYYFFRVSSNAKRSTRAFMLSFLAQMAIHLPEFSECLIEMDEEHANIHSMSTRLLWQKVFVDILFKFECNEPWYWIIDGLDEAERPSEVIFFIGKILTHTRIKVLIASRISIEIERDFQKLNLGTSFRSESIDAEDTESDMVAYTNQQLKFLPFNKNEREEIVSLIVHKSQGIFLWAKLALAEILATVHTKEGVREVLEGIPSEMTDFYQQILDGMSTNLRPSNKPLAKMILQFTTCAIRSLKTTELQAALQPTFGTLLDLKYTIHQVCPHLLKVNEATSVIQPIHGTVKDFLLQDQLSEFAVDPQKAHAKLTIACLEVWKADSLRDPIKRLSTCFRIPHMIDETLPLLRYSTQAWFQHLLESDINKGVISAVKVFLQNSVLFWVEAVGMLGRLWYLTQAARSLEHFVHKGPLSLAEKKLISGWAIDLVRIVPKFGRNIVAHPFSVHKLIPPFCPSHTCIYSQFGSSGDISIVGTAMKKWDDCLAHITVGQDGELCKALVCGNAHIAVSLSDAKGTVVLYVTETCQELRRFQHGERIGTMNMDSTGEQVITGGVKFIRLWNIKTGAMTAQFEDDAGTRCLAVCLRPDGKQLVSVASDDTLSIWNIEKRDRRHVRFSRPDHERRHRGAPWGVAFDSEGARVSVAYKGWPIEVWGIENSEIISTMPMRNPLGACFNPANEDVYGVDEDGTVMRLGEDSTEMEIDAQSHVLACNPSGTLLATGNGDGCLKIYATDTLELLYKIDKYDESIIALAFSPDGQRLYDIRYTDCNIWVPEILLVNVRDNEFSSEESETIRLPTTSILLESTKTLHNITALVCNSTGEYICCGQSNGRVSMYETRTGKQLQEVYKHAPTVSIASVVWSADGRTIASGDDSGRVIVVHIEPISSKSWKCDIILNFRLDKRRDGGVRQLLLNKSDDRLLVSSQMASSMFKVQDGSLVGVWQNLGKDETLHWIGHPNDPARVILITSQYARVFTWGDFCELTPENGIRLIFKPNNHVKPWDPGDAHLRTQAYLTQDGTHIVSALSFPGEWPTSAICKFWRVADFDEHNEVVEEVGQVEDNHIHCLVGTYRNRAVFLDRDLWVCTKAVDDEERRKQHFYVPFDWLNTSEERPAIITLLGEFVYAKHGELIIVKRGMRCTQDTYLEYPQPA